MNTGDTVFNNRHFSGLWPSPFLVSLILSTNSPALKSHVTNNLNKPDTLA